MCIWDHISSWVFGSPSKFTEGYKPIPSSTTPQRSAPLPLPRPRPTPPAHASTPTAPPPPYQAYRSSSTAKPTVSRPLQQHVSENTPHPEMHLFHTEWSKKQQKRFTGGSIHLLFLKDSSNELRDWGAFVQILVADLPKLMRDGLYWTEENLDREAGYVENSPHTNISPFLPAWITCGRIYDFRDLGSAPQWTAKMTVLCPDLDRLSRFRFRDLTVSQIVFCGAMDAKGKDVYMYSRLGEDVNINAIYDDMPLEGWWPWPKKGH